jgi:hypothetical protein
MDAGDFISREQIRDVILRYYRGVDRLDWDLVRSCFHPDAHASYPPFFEGGPDELLAFLSGDDGVAGFTRTMHMAGNMVVEVAGDVGRAETSCIAYHESRPDQEWAGAFVTIWMRSVDRFQCRDGVWRIARREIVAEWVRQEQGVTFLELPPEALGRRDREDISYRG